MNYLELLEHSYKIEKSRGLCPPESRLCYLGDSVFEFSTYDSEMSELFAKKAVEVCEAITKSATFDYIKDAENYRWYLIMCNMPFFYDRIEWGCSIRGAWWIHRGIKLEVCGLWQDNEQLLNLDFTRPDWELFTLALVNFTNQAES